MQQNCTTSYLVSFRLPDFPAKKIPVNYFFKLTVKGTFSLTLKFLPML